MSCHWSFGQEFEYRLSLRKEIHINPDFVGWILQLDRNKLFKILGHVIYFRTCFNATYLWLSIIVNDKASMKDNDQFGQPSNLGLIHLLLTSMGQNNL